MIENRTGTNYIPWAMPVSKIKTLIGTHFQLEHEYVAKFYAPEGSNYHLTHPIRTNKTDQDVAVLVEVLKYTFLSFR